MKDEAGGFPDLVFSCNFSFLLSLNIETLKHFFEIQPVSYTSDYSSLVPLINHFFQLRSL